jgi:hypothetical protein
MMPQSSESNESDFDLKSKFLFAMERILKAQKKSGASEQRLCSFVILSLFNLEPIQRL